MKLFQGLLIVVVGIVCGQGMFAETDFEEMVARLEASGGRDDTLEAEICGKAQQLRDDIRQEALVTNTELKGLRVRMEHVQDELARVGTALEQAHAELSKLSNAKNNASARARLQQTIKQLKSDQRKGHWEFIQLENEIQAHLLSDTKLAKPYKRLGKVQREWCD